jgi:hypothetical protein
MDRDIWAREYGRLITAYNRTKSAEQASVYFTALQHYPVTAVVEAVTGAIRESRGWPSAAELSERAHAYLAGHQAPASACDRCQGVKFLISDCAGWRTPQGGKPEPVDRQQLCRRDFPHAKHEDAHPCPRCHPLAQKVAAA